MLPDVAEDAQLGQQPVDDTVGGLEQPLPDQRGGDRRHGPRTEQREHHRHAQPAPGGDHHQRRAEADHHGAGDERRGEDHGPYEDLSELRVMQDRGVVGAADGGGTAGDQGTKTEPLGGDDAEPHERIADDSGQQHDRGQQQDIGLGLPTPARAGPRRPRIIGGGGGRGPGRRRALAPGRVSGQRVHRWFPPGSPDAAEARAGVKCSEAARAASGRSAQTCSRGAAILAAAVCSEAARATSG